MQILAGEHASLVFRHRYLVADYIQVLMKAEFWIQILKFNMRLSLKIIRGSKTIFNFVGQLDGGIMDWTELNLFYLLKMN